MPNFEAILELPKITFGHLGDSEIKNPVLGTSIHFISDCCIYLGKVPMDSDKRVATPRYTDCLLFWLTKHAFDVSRIARQ